MSDILFLSELTTTEAESLFAQHPVALLPIGATEAHGPHLPLDTDVIIATATAQAGGRLLQEAGIPTFILPAITYTVSLAGTSSPGTIPVSADAFSAYLHDVLTRIAGTNVRAIGICNAHLEPAHVGALETVIQDVTGTTACPIAFTDHRKSPHANALGSEFLQGARHAGSYETSIVMAATPNAVRRNALEDLPPIWVDLPARIREGAQTFAEAGSPLAYFGDPTQASAEHGWALLDILGRIVRDSVLESLTGK